MKNTSLHKKILHKISFRIFLLAGFAIVLGIVGFFYVMIPRFEAGLMEKKREMLKELVNVAYSEIENLDKKYLDGELTLEQAQKEASYRIQGLRYGPERKDYFWINDMTPILIVHPYRPDLIGKDLSDFQDENGKKLFIEFVQVVQKDGEGFVDYMWQWKDNSTQIAPKISFVKVYKNWGWIIGTGLYTDDVKKEIAQVIQEIIIIISGLMFVVTLISGYALWFAFGIEKHKNQAEQKLIEKEKQYKEFVEHIPVGIYRRGKNEELIMANPAFYALIGCKNGDNISCNTIFKDTLEKEEIIQNILKFGQVVNQEVQLVKTDGNCIWVSLNARAKFDKKGEVEYFDGVVEDISHRKIAEEKLKELDSKKSEFIGIVSHELRTPLTSIKGYLDMILDGDYGDISAELQQTISGIYLNSDRLMHLVNDMLDITKLESGKVEFVNEIIPVAPFLENIFHTYKNIVEEKNIDFSLELEPDINIFTDKQKLHQIIINLISNACKHTPSNGKIILKTQRIDNNILISVVDNGVGIDAMDHQRVFSKFGQLDNVVHHDQKGTGLGLAIVKELLYQMGSEIHLSSQLGQGSTFSFSFPIYQE